MNNHYVNYILDENGIPQPVSDIIKWGQWFDHAKRHIARNHSKRGRVFISTVFLGLNHSFNTNSPPVLWETMIFGGKYGGYQERYTSREAALKGHRIAYRLAQGKKPKQPSSEAGRE